jgi:hypothetical protein
MIVNSELGIKWKWLSSALRYFQGGFSDEEMKFTSDLI